MVLFYDDERHVKKAPPTGWRKYLRRLIKVIVIFAVLLMITMWVLSTAGGNSKALKLGIQDYLTDATGYLAQLNTLDRMEFFPVTHIQFADLTLHQPVMKEKTAGQIADEKERRQKSNEVPQLKGVSDYYDAGEIVASIGSADVRMNFWDMFFSRRRFYVLDVKNISIEESVWLPRRLHLDALKVDEDSDFPAIVAQGRYGDDALEIRVRTKKAARGVYEIPDVTQFQLQIGALQAEGTIDTGGSASRIEFSHLRIGAYAFTGNLTMKERFQHTDITLDLKSGNSAIKADLSLNESEVKGTVTAAALDMDDARNIEAAYNDLRALWGGARNDYVAFGARHVDVRLIAEKLVHGEAQEVWGNAKADLVMQPYLWQLNNIAGLIGGGALKGSFSIDATGTGDAQLKADINLRGADYARRDHDKKAEVTGQADIYMRLNGAGKTFEALEKNVKGELVVIGGAGMLTQDTALYDGDKILNTMLPGLKNDQELALNCMMANFNVSGTKATAQTLFMDLSDLAVKGEGTIQLDDLSLDMKLTPELKKEGVLNRALAVGVKGAGADTKITANGAPSGKKSDGIMTGAIDFALSAFSLDDLGLHESHPCHAYIKKP